MRSKFEFNALFSSLNCVAVFKKMFSRGIVIIFRTLEINLGVPNS